MTCKSAARIYSRAVVGGFAYLAKDLGLEFVAEGVETLVQRDALLELGCNVGQRYLWRLPTPLLGSELNKASMCLFLTIPF